MTFKEEDMYKHIKKHYEKLGYKVDGEVKDCDVVCLKEDEIVVIEMKKTFNTKLLYQAISRQKITEKVYVAIPRPKKFTIKKRREITVISGRLGIGVILINMTKSKYDKFQIILEPKKVSVVVKKKREEILNELNNRNLNINVGGVTNKKINTAYKEKVVKIATALEATKENTAKELIKTFECDKTTNRILYINNYKWFENVSRGVYKLNEYGEKKLHSEEFKELYKYYKKDITKIIKEDKKRSE